MRSSTSSSRRAPDGPWGRTWVLALVLALVAMAGLEWLLRSNGFAPSVRDGAALWSSLRAVAADDESVVVLVGSSRFQLGVDPEILAEELGASRALQLSIDGSSPLPVLADLASDERFVGTVVCEISPVMIFTDNPPAERTPRAWLADYRDRVLLSDFEVRMQAGLQERVTLLLPGLKTFVLKGVALGRIPDPPYFEMRPDRYRPTAPPESEVERLEKVWFDQVGADGRRLDTAEIAGRVARIDGWAQRIRERGGEVVLVRMVSSGPAADAERRRFPRSATWDVLAAGVDARAIHFEDEPTLRDFRTSEGSHLHSRDVPAFTAALAALLSE